MRAGKLPHLIAITQRATTQDSTGGQVETFTPFATVYAGVRALSGRELEAAQAKRNEVTHKWQIRFLAGLAPDMRIEYGAAYYQILWFDDSGLMNREIFVYTSTGVAIV